MFADRLPASGQCLPFRQPQTMRKQRCPSKADPDALNVTLFRSAGGIACGWFIGPLAVVEGRPVLPYLAESKETMAAVAVVRAVEAGLSTGCDVCVIDPEGLWDRVWAS